MTTQKLVNDLKTIMIESLSRFKVDDIADPMVGALFTKVITSDKSILTRRLIDHFARAIAEKGSGVWQ